MTKRILSLSVTFLVCISSFGNNTNNPDSLLVNKVVVLENKIKILEKQVSAIKLENSKNQKSSAEPKYIIERRGSKQFIKVN